MVTSTRSMSDLAHTVSCDRLPHRMAARMDRSSFTCSTSASRASLNFRWIDRCSMRRSRRGCREEYLLRTLLAAGLQQLDQLRDPRRANIRPALGRVDPPEIVLAVETGERVEEPPGLGLGVERGCHVSRQGLARRMLVRE